MVVSRFLDAGCAFVNGIPVLQSRAGVLARRFETGACLVTTSEVAGGATLGTVCSPLFIAAREADRTSAQLRATLFYNS